MNGKDISRIEIITKELFVKTFPRSKRGITAAKKAMEFLENYNIFPITYGNPKTKILNYLGCLSHFSGSLRKDKYQGQICHDISESLDKFEDELGLTFFKTQDNYYIFGVNGATYTRILTEMGFSASEKRGTIRDTKSKRGVRLPDYLVRLIHDYDVYTINEKKLAGRYIRQMLEVHFQTKLRRYERDLFLNLMPQPSKELFYKEGLLAIKSLNHLFPLDLTSSNIHYYDDNGKKSGYLIIPLEKVISIPDPNNFPARVILDPQTRTWL